MTLDRTTTDPRQMSAAQFKVTRESLGLTSEWVAAQMDVNLRTVHRWEAGVSPVPEGVRIELDVLVGYTVDAVARMVETAQLEARAAELIGKGSPTLVTYRTDADYRRHQPQWKWPASWHRAVVARAAEQVPGASITYWEGP